MSIFNYVLALKRLFLIKMFILLNENVHFIKVKRSFGISEGQKNDYFYENIFAKIKYLKHILFRKISKNIAY